jgi:hypothetical protein
VTARWRTFGSLALLLALTAGFYWKITISGQWTFLEASDVANQVRPWLDFQAREFHAGHLPLWDPFEWGGHSLIGQVQPGLANPLNWILFAMPLRDGHIPITTLHWYWVLIHWMGAAFCYALCRDLRCGHVASILGGAVFALTGFMGHTDWPQILLSAAWIPLVLLFFLRVLRGERPMSSAAICGAALGMMFLGSHPVIPVFAGLVMGALWLWAMVRDRRRVRYAAIFGVICLGIAAAQVLPAVEYGKQALRWAGAPEPLHWNERVPFSEHARYSLGWPSVAGIVVPGISEHANPYLGMVAIALAALSIWNRRRLPHIGWLVAFALGGLCLALGKDFPPYWLLWRFVPIVEKAREPAFGIVLFHAGIAVLVALGATTLRLRYVWIALALFLAESVNDAAHLSRFDRPGSYATMIERQSDIAGFLKTQPGWFRVDIDEDAIPYNFGDLYGIEHFGALVSSMPERTQRLLGHEETPRLFGVQYHVGRTPTNPAQREVFGSRSGLKVFRDPRIAEPMWAMRTEPCASSDHFAAVTRTPDYVVIDADLACSGLVVVGDAFYPGWRARVDGRRAPVQEITAVRAVRAEKGPHRVEFVYRPASVYWGFGLAFGAVITVVALLIRDFRQGGANQHTDSIAVFETRS